MYSYCYTTTTSDALEDLIWQLEGIWKYAALDYHIRAKSAINNKSRKANEYAITLMKLWDTLDKISRDSIERAVVELEGKIMSLRQPESRIQKKRMANMKALRTQLVDYLQVREEHTTTKN